MSDRPNNWNAFTQKERSMPNHAPESASPCGQKFSGGTPHPESLWRSDMAIGERMYRGDGVELFRGVCLICQSEEMLRGLVAKWRRIASNRSDVDIPNTMLNCADELASLLAPPPTAREAT